MNAPSTPSTPRRRWRQFNLRTVFIVVTLVCLALGIAFEWSKGLWSDPWLAQRLEDRGADVQMVSSPVGAPFKYLVGDTVKSISRVQLKGRLFNDADVARLIALDKVKEVELKDTAISLLAARRLADRCVVTPTHLFPSEENYEHCQEVKQIGYISTCLTITNHEWALRWKLASLRGNGDPEAERQAYEQCINSLSQLRLSGLTETWVGEELCAAKITALEMQLAVLEHDPAKAIRLGEAWPRRLQGLQLIEWPTQLDLVHPYQVAVLLLATRLTREVRGRVAELRGDQPAQLAASDQAIATIRATLQKILSPTDDPELQTVRTRWTSSLVVALELEQVQRAHVAGNPRSTDDDARLLRRVRLACDDLISLLSTEEHCRPVKHRRAMLGLAEQLLFEAGRRHPSLAHDRQFEREYTDYFQYVVGENWQLHSSRPLPMTDLIAYLLRREERTGMPAQQLKQYELDKLILNQRVHSWPSAHPAPSVPQWQEEFKDELHLVLDKAAARGPAE